MTDLPDSTPVEPVVEEAPATQLSIVDVIRQKQKELESAKEVYIPVKGYEAAGLAVRYRMPESGKLLDELVRRAMRESKDEYYRNLNATMDIMINLCGGLYVQNPGTDDYLMFDPVEVGTAVHFDQDLASVLGLEGETNNARSVIKKLFGNKELAVLNHAEKLQRWINDSNADVSSELWQLDGNFQ